MSTGPTFSFDTTADDVATAFLDEIKGKNVLVTGTSLKGIGFETARVIAKYANRVIITGYNAERLKLSEEAIKKEIPQANVYPLVLDLLSFANVRKAAAEINAQPEPLHVLINNAASSFVDFKLTEDGLETQLATDHVGPFLFTKLLTPKLLASATPTYTPRVVFVSSEVQAFGTGVDFDALEHPDPAKYSQLSAYSQAKSANILTAIELSKRSKGKINAYSLHPGMILTNVHEKEGSIPLLQDLGVLDADKKAVAKHPWKTVPQGAATTVAAAFDPRLNDKPGAYLDNSTVADHLLAPHSSDPVKAEKLWNVTEKIIGEAFVF
ncbi:hypothetical protein C8F04DRAFT_1092245 [Mycena alexandri]|uniref:Short-chain dehydrogenase/reductase n=1 Tax=Mycena alexandri TaxID=1745969 RepID=A0AAD6T105_9AGAR|nr:hypothetical protein C8F04DRAFT_1092245 [Mycena alexandri]